MAITEMRKDYDFQSNQLDYDPKYWDDLFLIWYNNGRMPAKRFHEYVEQNIGPDPVNGRMPIVATFKHWIEDEWSKRADMLDEEVAKQLNEKLVTQKIEMLQRHAEIGRKLQNQALEFLEQNGLGNSRNAVVALTEGLKIEKESAGVIPFFEKVQDMSDDALVSELKKLVAKSPLSIEAEDINKTYE